MKLHPLHTPEWVAAYVKNKGEYPGGRCTGRTTAMALSLLSCSIQCPGEVVAVHDHHGTTLAHNHLFSLMMEMAAKLGLGHFTFNRAELTVTFGK